MEKEIYQKAIDKYGAVNQILKAIEEHSELIKELLKNIQGEANRDKVIEELNDSIIMNEQLVMIFNVSLEELAEQRVYKLDRLAERIKK